MKALVTFLFFAVLYFSATASAETCWNYPNRYPQHYPNYRNTFVPRGFWQCTAYDRYNRATTISNYNLYTAQSQAIYLCGGPQWCYIPPNGCLFVCN